MGTTHLPVEVSKIEITVQVRDFRRTKIPNLVQEPARAVLRLKKCADFEKKSQNRHANFLYTKVNMNQYARQIDCEIPMIKFLRP